MAGRKVTLLTDDGVWIDAGVVTNTLYNATFKSEGSVDDSFYLELSGKDEAAQLVEYLIERFDLPHQALRSTEFDASKIVSHTFSPVGHSSLEGALFTNTEAAWLAGN